MSLDHWEHIDNINFINDVFFEFSESENKNEKPSILVPTPSKATEESELRTEYRQNLSAVNKSKKVLKSLATHAKFERRLLAARISGYNNVTTLTKQIQDKNKKMCEEFRRCAIDEAAQKEALATLDIRWDELDAKLECALDDSMEDLFDSPLEEKSKYTALLEKNELLKFSFEFMDEVHEYTKKTEAKNESLRKRISDHQREERRLDEEIKRLVDNIKAKSNPVLSELLSGWMAHLHEDKKIRLCGGSLLKSKKEDFTEKRN